MGAVGIARCFQVSGGLGHPLYYADDPFCISREPDDGHYTIDHFYTKLLKLADTMNTDSAIREADNRIRFMKHYLEQLEGEIKYS